MIKILYLDNKVIQFFKKMIFIAQNKFKFVSPRLNYHEGKTSSKPKRETNPFGKCSGNHIGSSNRKKHEHITQVIAQNRSRPCTRSNTSLISHVQN